MDTYIIIYNKNMCKFINQSYVDMEKCIIDNLWHFFIKITTFNVTTCITRSFVEES
jgi:hypothetical protein